MSCSRCCFKFFSLNSSTPRPLLFFRISTLNPLPAVPLRRFSSSSFSSSHFIYCPPGTQAQQAFRTEPRNLTVRMGATAVLRCEVLRPSGTVQWVKDGLLLGPQRSLPGFPRYSMIGNLKRGELARNKFYGLLDFYGPIGAEKKKNLLERICHHALYYGR